MSFVVTIPGAMASAATDLAGIGFTIGAANAAAAAPTNWVLAAGADEVSAAIAAVFSTHGQGFQALSAQAVAFHDQFVQALKRGRVRMRPRRRLMPRRCRPWCRVPRAWRCFRR